MWHDGAIKKKQTKLKTADTWVKIQLGRNLMGANRISVYGKTRGEVSEKLITIAHQAIEGHTIYKRYYVGRVDKTMVTGL